MRKFFGWLMVPAVALSLSIVPAFSATQEKDEKKSDKKKAKSKKKAEEKKDK